MFLKYSSMWAKEWRKLFGQWQIQRTMHTKFFFEVILVNMQQLIIFYINSLEL